MAQQVSNIKVQGTVDGITYFERNGKFYARRKPTQSRAVRDANPLLEDFRNHGKEFGGAQRPVGEFNEGIDSVKSLFVDKTLSKRLGRIFRSMIKRAPGAAGSRPVDPLGNKDLLEGLEMSDRLWFGEVTKLSSAFTVNAARNEVTLTVQPFDPTHNIKAPGRATHFQIINHAAILSRYEYDRNENSYLPVDKNNKGKNFTSLSDLIPLDVPVADPISLVTLLSGVEGIQDLLPTSAVMASIGIRFYEERLGSMYPIATGGAMKLQKVF